MKKLLLVLPIVALFAAGCTSSQQAPTGQAPTQTPVVQNSNPPTATPSSTSTPNSTPTSTSAPTSTPTSTNSPVHVNSFNPTSGPVGTQVTVTGSGFTQTGNVVDLGGGGITDISATANNTVVTFSIPQSVGPYCLPGKACPMFRRVITPGAYSIAVTNGNGLTSNALTFTVTGGNLPLQP